MSSRLPLIGGSYSARSIIANAQRCINLFPEANPRDAPVPMTHYQRPGLAPLAQGPNAPVRGLYRASMGRGFAVIGTNFYEVNPNWTLTQRGAMAQNSGQLCSMTDNGIELMLVDGSTLGYSFSFTTNTWTQIDDPQGFFVGATRVDNLDTFLLWNFPGTSQFGSTLSNQITPFNPLYIASKAGYPDPLATLVVTHRYIILLGALKSEIWYDAGNSLFPFAELPGSAIDHGCLAPYSAASADVATYWLGQDLQGQGIVWRLKGELTQRISNHALEFQLRKAAKTQPLSDAIGYTYQQDGHVFYVLTFPSADFTWVWDETSSEWHQRGWTDADGLLHRERANCAAFLFGTNVVGDWENGTLYALDLDTYTDTVGGTVYPCSYIRTFPHILAAVDPQGRPIAADGKRMQFSQFLADLECGEGALDAAGNAPQVSLRWSDDRGRTWGNALLQSAGPPGAYLTQPQWRGLGIARDRVFELNYSINGPAALNGAWVDAEVLGT